MKIQFTVSDSVFVGSATKNKLGELIIDGHVVWYHLGPSKATLARYLTVALERGIDFLADEKEASRD